MCRLMNLPAPSKSPWRQALDMIGVVATASIGARPMVHFINALRRTFEFSGRSSRSEFWYYVLVMLLIKAFALLVDFAFNKNGPFLIGFVWVVFTIPTISAAVRRLHDTDRSGLWVIFFLVPIFGLILLFVLAEPSTEGSNRFGPSPLGEPPLVVAETRWRAFQRHDKSEVDPVPRWEFRKKISAPEEARGITATLRPVSAAVQSSVDALGNDTLEKLERIAALKQSGALTQDEFDLLKRRALES